VSRESFVVDIPRRSPLSPSVSNPRRASCSRPASFKPSPTSSNHPPPRRPGTTRSCLWTSATRRVSSVPSAAAPPSTSTWSTGWTSSRRRWARCNQKSAVTLHPHACTLSPSSGLSPPSTLCSFPSQALGGATGGYTTGRGAVVGTLRQKARPYLFSNSIAPCVVGAALEVRREIVGLVG
jgi:hypothetical protein